jgi:hypothetical protein
MAGSRVVEATRSRSARMKASTPPKPIPPSAHVCLRSKCEALASSTCGQQCLDEPTLMAFARASQLDHGTLPVSCAAARRILDNLVGTCKAGHDGLARAAWRP